MFSTFTMCLHIRRSKRPFTIEEHAGMFILFNRRILNFVLLSLSLLQLFQSFGNYGFYVCRLRHRLCFYYYISHIFIHISYSLCDILLCNTTNRVIFFLQRIQQIMRCRIQRTQRTDRP